MGIDYDALGPQAIRKGTLGVISRRAKRLSNEDAEKACRKEVWRLYGRKCNVPGCRERAVHQHHIVYRSQSRRLKYEPTNRAPICHTHHDLEHAGKITIHPRTADGELIVTGERKYLEFRL
jgi:hypothetical protein